MEWNIKENLTRLKIKANIKMEYIFNGINNLKINMNINHRVFNQRELEF